MKNYFTPDTNLNEPFCPGEQDLDEAEYLRKERNKKRFEQLKAQSKNWSNIKR